VPEKAPDVVVSETVDASPAAVWALVGDPARIGEISPECYSIRWLGGADGPKPGARFIGWNRKGLLRWPTTSTIAEYEPEQAISWDVDVVGQSVARWSFTLEPEGAGTKVTQRWQDKRTAVAALVGKGRTSDSPSHNKAGMERTLRTVKSRVEG
jgi:carbon monoxide dehydrogenase subunit G